MRSLRRVGGALVASSLAGVFTLAPSAHAVTAAPVVQTPELFQGSSSAFGLDLALNGQTATIGTGLAQLTSQLLSSADGTAIMSLLGTTKSSAKVSGSPNGSSTDGPHCSPVINLVVLAINNACTASASTMSNGLGHATTVNSVDSIQLTLNSVLQAVPLGQQLTTTLQNIVNQLPSSVGPVQLDPVKSTVGGVLSDVLKTP